MGDLFVGKEKFRACVLAFMSNKKKKERGNITGTIKFTVVGGLLIRRHQNLGDIV